MSAVTDYPRRKAITVPGGEAFADPPAPLEAASLALHPAVPGQQPPASVDVGGLLADVDAAIRRLKAVLTP